MTQNCAPTHPGEFILHGFMLPLDVTLAELAKAMGIPRDAARDLVNGELPCTPDLAEKLEVTFGQAASFWLSAQRLYDAWIEENSTDDAMAAN